MKLTRRHWIILGVVVAAAVVAYFGYRWYVNRQGSESGMPQGLGSNLNSPAPELGAPGSASSPSVGPAVEIPVTIKISHSASEEPESEANPYRRMISGGGASPYNTIHPFRTPLRAAANPGLMQKADLRTDKDGASPYSTTMNEG